MWTKYTLLVLYFLCFLYSAVTESDDILPAPVLNRPQDTLRTETFWNFTFDCTVYNVSSDVSSDVELSVIGGPYYDTNQTVIQNENDTDLYDVVLYVDSGFDENEGYSFRCEAHYIKEGENISGAEVEIVNTGTGVDIFPHPESYDMNENVTLSCQIEILSRLEEGDSMQRITWYYNEELMCSCGSDLEWNVTEKFRKRIYEYSIAEDLGNSELTLTISSCDGLSNFTCEVQTTNNRSGNFVYDVEFEDGKGYPDPYGDILGPKPPTDEADWGFSYECYVDKTLEMPLITLNVTGAERLENSTQYHSSSETCLYNTTYEEELLVSFGSCVSFLCVVEYPGRDPQTFVGQDVCYTKSDETKKHGIEAWQVVVIVIACIVLIVLIILGIRWYTRRSKGYENIEKIN